MVKVGDKIRILFDGADHANVQRGDEFVVSEVFDGEYVEVEGEYNWVFSSYVYEVIPAEPPQKITQNGYEYELVGPVKPDWLVDGAWIVRKDNGETHQINQQSENMFSATSSHSRVTAITAKRVADEFRPHEPKDYKWGDWAMYGNERVFVIRVGSQGTCVITRRSSDSVFDYVPVSELTPTF